jgi:AcrR family transcriptional regulator
MRKPKDATQSRAEILAAAIQEFATRGLEGARVEAIAKRTRTTRAMIYYYFGSKGGLYVAVLENAYRGIREAEKKLDLAHLPPVDAMRCLVGFTFDYYHEHPSFVALVIAENQSGGRYIRKVTRMHRLNVSIIEFIAEVLARGAREGVFRTGLDPVDVHMTIASLGWFQIANRHTFGYIFGRDFTSPPQIARNRELITETVLRFVAVRPGEDDESRP